MSAKVKIFCKKHGYFYQLPKDHIRGHGCKDCGNEKSQKNRKFTLKYIENQINELYDKKYEIKSNYVNNRTNILLFCKLHNIQFKQNPQHLLNGYISCMYCSLTAKKDTNYFINNAINKIGNNFDYSRVDYVTMKNHVYIKCLKHDIVFKILPDCFLNGQNNCKKCIGSNDEKKILTFLETQKIQYHVEKTFENCVYKRNLRFDFYIPEVNCLIEYDGMQHFKDIKYFSNFEKLRIKDIIKNKFCLENNIPLLRIAYTDYKFISTLIKSFINRVKHGFMGIVYSNPSLYKK
jgi:hypothetical protein